MTEPLPSTQYTIARAVHPTLLRMAEEQRPLPGRFKTRAELVEWLCEMVADAQLDVIRYQQRLEGARKNCAYWEAELLAQSAVLQAERTRQEQARQEDPNDDTRPNPT